MDSGAHFYRADFQVHTPRDLDWTGGVPEVTDAERFQYACRFVQACRDKGVQVVGITDHHDICFAKYIQVAAQNGTSLEEPPEPGKQDPKVFPGVELTTAAPGQAIVLLDATADTDIQQILLHTLSITPHPNGEAKGPSPSQLDIHTLEDLDGKLRSRAELSGRYIILPHVGQRGSHRTFIRDGFQKKYAEMPCVAGYIEHDWEKHHQRLIVEGKDPQWGSKRIAIFQTSDCRFADFRDLGKRATWVKLGEFTAEALRQASLGMDSRVRQTPPVLPRVFIERVEVSDSKFLGPVALNLNSQFNAVIGGRGTGKSTLLEYVRWAMHDESAVPASEADGYDPTRRRQVLVTDTLVPWNGIVTVWWQADGKSHVVRRDSTSGRTILQIGGGDEKEVAGDDVKAILPLRGYSQKQLSTIATKKEELRRFLEEPIRKELEGVSRQLAEVGKSVRQWYGKLMQRRSLGRQLSQLSTRLDSIRQRAGEIEESLVDLTPEAKAVIAERSARLREKQAVESMMDDADRVRKILRDSIGQISHLPHGPQIEADSPQRQALEEMRGLLQSALKRVVAGLDELLGSFQGDRDRLADAVALWYGGHREHAAAFRKARDESSVHQANTQALDELRKTEAKLGKQVQDLNHGLQELEGCDQEFETEWNEWISLHRRRGDVLEHQCKNLEQRSGGDIVADLLRGHDLGEALSKLQQQLVGSYVGPAKLEELSNLVLDAEDPLQAWGEFLWKLRTLAEVDKADVSGATDLPKITGWELTDPMRSKIAEQLTPEGWLDIALSSLNDLPRFYYTGSGQKTDFEKASSGQQATALLKALLEETGPPLLIDQPEEDLDNQVISEIVERVWEAKEKRQLIFASHNANMVVNGDAELVVHCDYSEEGQSRGRIHKPGCIDSEPIRRAITTVMEGGKRAFQLRREKYGF